MPIATTSSRIAGAGAREEGAGHGWHGAACREHRMNTGLNRPGLDLEQILNTA